MEIATLEWVDWWNHRRLLGSIGHIPPADTAAYYDQHEATETVGCPTKTNDLTRVS